MDSETTVKSQFFNDFWESSTFTKFNIQEFASAQEEFNSKLHEDSVVQYPHEPFRLPKAKNALTKITQNRKSEREFSNDPLNTEELATIFSSFRCIDDLEHRTYPSAGGRYGVEIYSIVTNAIDFDFDILYYNPDLHALSLIGKAPQWDELKPNINVETNGEPQCIILFVIFPDRLTEKYAERGGRFALIEVGAALQQLSLQVAASKKLKGVAAGGLLDNYWLDLLNLNKNEAKLALGYLCGK